MNRGFTLIEICLAIFIAMLVIGIAVPSLSGVLEGQKREEGFEAFNNLVQEARLRSMEERRSWVLEWPEGQQGPVVMRPSEPRESDEPETLVLAEGATLAVEFPAALVDRPPAIWTFWPSGNCEAAIVSYEEGKSTWRASYHPLTARPEMF